jgi:hypothetical protein
VAIEFSSGDVAAAIAAPLRTILAQDGRGSALLVAPPLLPAPTLRAVLHAIRKAEATRLELAVWEPRLQGQGEVLTALPIEVAGLDPVVTRAIAEARLEVSVTGRGPTLWVDGRPVPQTDLGASAFAQLVRLAARAYPRQTVARLSVGTDVMYQQLLDVVIALEGGIDPAFKAVGLSFVWPTDAAPIESDLLERRAALGRYRVATRDVLDDLAADDLQRFEGFAEHLRVCLPELELVRPASIRIALDFLDGRFREATVTGGRAAKQRKGEVVACIADEALGMRLAKKEGAVRVTVTYREAGS